MGLNGVCPFLCLHPSNMNCPGESLAILPTLAACLSSASCTHTCCHGSRLACFDCRDIADMAGQERWRRSAMARSNVGRLEILQMSVSTGSFGLFSHSFLLACSFGGWPFGRQRDLNCCRRVNIGLSGNCFAAAIGCRLSNAATSFHCHGVIGGVLVLIAVCFQKRAGAHNLILPWCLTVKGSLQVLGATGGWLHFPTGRGSDWPGSVWARRMAGRVL